MPTISPGALFRIIALRDYIDLMARKGDSAAAERWRATLDHFVAATRTALWDGTKWRPHLYFAAGDPVVAGYQPGSPFPADYDEDAVYYHGG
jgi:cellobiose phosphorylase